MKTIKKFLPRSVVAGIRFDKSDVVFLVVLATVGLSAGLQAIARPLWFDELCTLIVSKSALGVWSALADAADTNPPLFYFAARLGRLLTFEEHLGDRLPSILGLLGAVYFVYAILCKRVDKVSALVGSSFILCTPLVGFGSEARPYALVVGCIAGAIFAWQRIDSSRIYAFLLAIAVAASLSLHYYAIFAWPAFAIAEASVIVFRRQFRCASWIAIFAGLVPLPLFAKLLRHLYQYYGHNFWSQPSIRQLLSTPSYLFNFGDFWGVSFTVGAIALLISGFTMRGAPHSRAAWQRTTLGLAIEECVLIVGLLLIPVIAYIATKVSGGGMSQRYTLSAILGGALALGVLTSRAIPSIRVGLLALVLLNYGLSTIPSMLSLVKGSLLQVRVTAIRNAELLLNINDGRIPIVISSGLQYLPLTYYKPPNIPRQFIALVDPAAAALFSAAKSDSVDLALLALRRYASLDVEDYHHFATEYREFLLISNGDPFDWWPSRLLHDGYKLTLYLVNGNMRIYKVDLPP